MNKHGTEIFAPASSGVVSQLRSKLRYQFRPPVNPVRENSADVVVELVLADPVRQPVGFGKAIDEAFRAGGHHPQRRALVAGCSQAAHHPADRPGGVAVEFGVGDTRLLEIQHVEEVLTERAAQRLRRRHLRAGQRRDAQRGDGRDSVGVQQRRIPHHDGTPVVANPDGALGADVVEQADDVGGQLVNVVGLDRIRTRRAAVAALIGSQHVVAGVGEDRNLVPPGVGQLGKAVGQDHHGCAAVPGLDHPQPHTIGVH